MKPKYSKTKLLKLLKNSAAYAAIPKVKKDDIQIHLKLNNVAILQYIYYVLLEEEQINDLARAELAEKMFKISEKTAKSTLPLIKKIVNLKTAK